MFKGDVQFILCITCHLCLQGSLEDFTYEIIRSTLFSVNNYQSKIFTNVLHIVCTYLQWPHVKQSR